MTTGPPARFRHRTPEVEAVQWTGSNADQLRAFCGPNFDEIDLDDRVEDPDQTAAVREADHGTWRGLAPGDWVVRLDEGLYEFAAADFAKQYEPAPSAAVSPPPATDRAGLRDRIAAALSEARRPGLGGMTEAEAVAYMADAVLSVLPPAADRAAVLREAADAITTVIERDRAYSPRRSNDRAALGGAREIVLGLIDGPSRLAAGERDEQQAQQGGAETGAWYRTGGFDQHDDYRTDVPAAAPVAGQPPADTGEEAREEIECANCWRVVENRSVPNMGGPSRDNWVHVPGGFQPCFPQRPNSPRAEPELAVVPQPETVHGCPPDGSGLTPCCGRPPVELPLTDRISSEAPVTCKGA